jgi:hypothetical protein
LFIRVTFQVCWAGLGFDFFAFATHILRCGILLAHMTFTPEQQREHRETFIKKCRQKAWGAACNADWIGKQFDNFVEDYGKLKAEDEKLAGEIKALEIAVDAHTKDNRDKRKALQERRYALAKPPANRDVNEAAKNIVMMDLAILQAEAAAGMYKKPLEALAREIHYEPLPPELRVPVIAAWIRGDMLPRAAIEHALPSVLPLSVLQIFRSVVDDPVARAASAPADIIIIDRPEPESANNNSAKQKWRRQPAAAAPPRRLEPVALLGAAAAHAARPAGAPASRARAWGQRVW